MMNGIERNRVNYSHVAQTQRDGVLAEQWQKQSNDKNTLLQAKQNPLQTKQQQQLSQMQSVLKTKRVQSIQTVDNVDTVDGVEGIEGNISLAGRINFQNVS